MEALNFQVEKFPKEEFDCTWRIEKTFSQAAEKEI